MPERGFAASKNMRTVLWIARISSAVLVIFLVFMVVGYTINPQGDGSGPTGRERIGLALFPFGLCVGYIIGWRWQLLGGIFSLVCMGAFIVLMREWDMALIGLIALVPAILYITYGIHRHQKISGAALTDDQK
jgi:hypothetical protein